MTHPYYKIKVVIADDHEMVREGLQLMISKIDDLEVVGEAANGEQLVTIARMLQPDVVLMDVKMPIRNGVEAAKIIRKEFPQIGIVALSSFDEESMILDVLNAGAKGYLLKNASKEEITAAVKAVHKDETYYCREIHLKLANIIARGGTYLEAKRMRDQFKERELEIIQMICEGLSSKQIGERLGLKPRTIERYRDVIMEKMEVNNAAGLVMYAFKNGIYKLPENK